MKTMIRVLLVVCLSACSTMKERCTYDLYDRDERCQVYWPSDCELDEYTDYCLETWEENLKADKLNAGDCQ